jgi:hypothetical protein
MLGVEETRGLARTRCARLVQPNELCLSCGRASWPKLARATLGLHALLYLLEAARASEARPAASFKHKLGSTRL